MKIYRIENRKTGLGPFQHKTPKQRHPLQLTIHKSVNGSINAFEDLDHIPEVKNLLNVYKDKIFFGFANERDVNKAIINENKLNRSGFAIVVLDVKPLFISKAGTVMFLRT